MDKEAVPFPQLNDLPSYTKEEFEGFNVCFINPLHFTTVKIGKVGKIFGIFFFKKKEISIMHKAVYSFSCKMMYSFSFSFAILRRYLTIFFVSPYLLARYISVTLPVP